MREPSFYFDPELAKALRMHCVVREVDVSSFVTGLVRRALAKSSA